MGLRCWAGRGNGAFGPGLLCVLDRHRLGRRRIRRAVRRSIGSFLAGVDDPLPAFRNFCGVILIVIAITWNLHVRRVAADHDA